MYLYAAASQRLRFENCCRLSFFVFGQVLRANPGMTFFPHGDATTEYSVLWVFIVTDVVLFVLQPHIFCPLLLQQLSHCLLPLAYPGDCNTVSPSLCTLLSLGVVKTLLSSPLMPHVDSSNLNLRNSSSTNHPPNYYDFNLNNYLTKEITLTST